MRFNTRSSRTTEQPSFSRAETGTLTIERTPSALPEAPQQNKGALLLALMEELQRDMKETRAEISELRSDFQTVAEEQGVQHKIFDTLHTELSDYKNDFVSARMKPMLSAMLFFYDAITGFHGELDSYVDAPDWLGDRVLKKELVSSNLVYFQEQLDEILRMCELLPLTPEVGTPVELKIHNVTLTEPTDDPALDNHISKVVRLGWTQGEKLFRPAEVAIWKVQSQ